jgi:predicted RNA methylase
MRPLVAVPVGENIKNKHLAMRLSQLLAIDSFSAELEQYPTSGSLAAKWLTDIANDGLIDGSVVVDLGAGNGILGLGAALLGAKHVVLLECQAQAAAIARLNAIQIGDECNATIEVKEARLSDWPRGMESDLVIMNPPWGFQTKGADRVFIEAALSSPAESIHLLHSQRATHPAAMANDAGWNSELRFDSEFSLPANMAHHTKNSAKTMASVWRFTR